MQVFDLHTKDQSAVVIGFYNGSVGGLGAKLRKAGVGTGLTRT